jgi:hypothetical protein
MVGFRRAQRCCALGGCTNRPAGRERVGARHAVPLPTPDVGQRRFVDTHTSVLGHHVPGPFACLWTPIAFVDTHRAARMANGAGPGRGGSQTRPGCVVAPASCRRPIDRGESRIANGEWWGFVGAQRRCAPAGCSSLLTSLPSLLASRSSSLASRFHHLSPSPLGAHVGAGLVPALGACTSQRIA